MHCAGPYRGPEVLERLRLELGERVAAAGPAAEMGPLFAAFKELAAPPTMSLAPPRMAMAASGPRPGPPVQPVQLATPSNRLQVAYLYCIATCEFCR